MFKSICSTSLALSLSLLVFAPTFALAKDGPECTQFLTDYSQSQKYSVSNIVAPKTMDELVHTVTTATLPIAVRGGGFSMGGQTASNHGLVIELKNLNRVLYYNPRRKLLSIQAGATWRQVQELIDRDNLSVKVMQSYNNFQVGGALSVNAHGRYVNYGPIISTVHSINVLLANGEIMYADRERNADLFYGAIGGYGAMGIIVDATLELTENEKLERTTREFSGETLSHRVQDYIHYFESEIENSGTAVMTNADMYPPHYNNIRSITYRRTDLPLTTSERLQPVYKFGIKNSFQSLMSSYNQLFTTFKTLRDIYQAPAELKTPRVVWKNFEASYDLNELAGFNDNFPWTKAVFGFANRKALLQEYFIPRHALPAFSEKMKEIFLKHDVNVSNVSIRQVPKNTESVLAWSREESFALVVYYTQDYGFNPKPRLAKAQVWTQEMLREVLAVGGSYYLPYQLYASSEQFREAYPRADEFFELKKKFDPSRKFSNLMIDRYFPKD